MLVAFKRYHERDIALACRIVTRKNAEWEMAKRNEASNPIFVVGTPRSGTTLTARILGRHSRIFMPAETHFFDDIYARRGSLGEPGRPGANRAIAARLSTLYGRQHEGGYQKRMAPILDDRRSLERLIAACRSYDQVLSRFMELQMASSGKARWGNHVPRDIFNVAEVLTLFPDAKIVVCLRDLRDFLLSYSGMKEVVRAKHAARHRRIYHPIVTTLLWMATAKRARSLSRLLPDGKLLYLRYEDIVRAPEATARKLCAFVGEAYESDMLAVRGNNSSVPSTRGAAEGIFESSVGRWRDGLPPEHAYLAQKLGGGLLETFGYQVEPIAVAPVRVLRPVLSFPVALVRGLHANRAKQGALLPYVARRAASLLRHAPRSRRRQELRT